MKYTYTIVDGYCEHYDSDKALVLLVKIDKQAPTAPKVQRDPFTKPYPSQQQLLELFDYDPARNTLLWKRGRKGVKAGAIAGCQVYTNIVYTTRTTRRVKIDSEPYIVRRLIDIYLGRHSGQVQ
jgi:hypothetical protein